MPPAAAMPASGASVPVEASRSAPVVAPVVVVQAAVVPVVAVVVPVVAEAGVTVLPPLPCVPVPPWPVVP
ncbi:hypothetical protein ACFQ1I_12140 [Kitasatospora arboriphila]